MNFVIYDINNEKLNFNLENINLSSHNPRYTTLNSINDNLLDKIKDIYNKTQIEVLFDLLSNEGDLSDLRNLFESINDISFDSLGENILIVKCNGENEYAVAEGNRRIMTMKLIQGLDGWELPPLEKIYTQDNKEITGQEIETDGSFMQRRKQNYKKIEKLLDEIKKKKDLEFNIHVKVIDNDEELWKLIYTKHIAGERPGMRVWSRGKYFTDILSFFKDGISLKNGSNDQMQKIRKLLQREPKIIVNDYKHAQFVKCVLRYAKYDVHLEQVTDAMIYKTMKNIKITALQHDFSLKRIKDSANEFLNISEAIFERDYFKFNYDNENLIQFIPDKKISNEKIFTFIYEQYQNGVITTRPIVKSKQTDFNLEVKKLLSCTDFNPKDKQTEQTLKNSDSFDHSIDKLEQIIFNARSSGVSESTIKRFIVTKDIKQKNSEIENLQNGIFSAWDQPLEVFGRLRQQYIHNQNNKVFLNAAGATLRALLEQIIIWGSYNYDDAVKNAIAGDNDIEVKRDKYASELANGKINNIFFGIRQNTFKSSDIKQILNSICKVDMTNESMFILNRQEEINFILNEFIHASHRIYISSSYNKNLTKFSEWQSTILNIAKNLDENKMQQLNEAIKIKIT